VEDILGQITTLQDIISKLPDDVPEMHDEDDEYDTKKLEVETLKKLINKKEKLYAIISWLNYLLFEIERGEIVIKEDGTVHRLTSIEKINLPFHLPSPAPLPPPSQAASMTAAAAEAEAVAAVEVVMRARAEASAAAAAQERVVAEKKERANKETAAVRDAAARATGVAVAVAVAEAAKLAASNAARAAPINDLNDMWSNAYIDYNTELRNPRGIEENIINYRRNYMDKLSEIIELRKKQPEIVTPLSTKKGGNKQFKTRKLRSGYRQKTKNIKIKKRKNKKKY
jgi:hypothetical protein